MLRRLERRDEEELIHRISMDVIKIGAILLSCIAAWMLLR